jgi:hypothetical protein
MLQEYFVREALKEIGLRPRAGDVQIDHELGQNEVYGLRFGIKYPREYLRRTDLIPINRKYKYAFSGNMQASGRRKEMLAPFEGPESFIEETQYGRNANTKYSYNDEYYTLIRSSYFSLCPHQADWKGPVETMWTYRFIESTFAKSLPIMFRLAPCSEVFLAGFQYYWDDEAHGMENYDEKLEANRRLAEERFFFTSEEADRIKQAARR